MSTPEKEDYRVRWLKRRRMTRTRLDELVRSMGKPRDLLSDLWFCTWEERERLLTNGAVIALKTVMDRRWLQIPPKELSQQLHATYSLCDTFPDAYLLCFLHYYVESVTFNLMACKPEHVCKP